MSLVFAAAASFSVLSVELLFTTIISFTYWWGISAITFPIELSSLNAGMITEIFIMNYSGKNRDYYKIIEKI